MSDVEKCPKCGAKLEEGFLVSPRPLWWDTKRHKWTTGGEQIIPQSAFVTNLEAHRCQKCKLVMFEYGKNE